MNLKKLQEAIAHFKKHLRSKNRFDYLYLFEAQRNWQEAWDVGLPDLALVYDRSLQNTQTRRLWKRENYEPKAMMLKFIGLQEDLVRDMFGDLFDESKEIIGRVDRFLFHADVLLEAYKDKNRTTIENRHFHDDDYQIISLYLALEFPDLYAYYQFRSFRRFLVVIGSLDVPEINDLGRFFKVMRTVYKFLEKDEEVLSLHKSRLDNNKHYVDKSLLLATEMYLVVAELG